ncbi:MAG: hypothetical protein ACU0CA_16915 [Paracoccaceae bacterium]
MQVAIHLGFHATDEDRILKAMLQNKGVLAKENICIPGPGRYRGPLVDVIQQLKGDEASAETRDMLLDEFIDDDDTERVVLSFHNFICIPSLIFEGGMLYEKANYKAMWLRNAFPGTQVEFFLSIRNPATFIPAAYHHKGQNIESFNGFLNDVDLLDIRWSDIVLAIKESNPDSPVTVWCNEETPLLWTEIIRAISGHAADTEMSGDFDMLSTIMRKEGIRRLRDFLGKNPPRNDKHRRRIVDTFLDKYLIDDAIDEEIDISGWTDQLVDELTQIYEDDLEDIVGMEGVTFLTP